MRKLLVLWAFLCLAGCSKVDPPNPVDVITEALSKGGMHVADVTLLANVSFYSTETASWLPKDLCNSAPTAASFRGFQDGKTVIGVACLEKDGYLNIALERTYQ